MKVSSGYSASGVRVLRVIGHLICGGRQLADRVVVLVEGKQRKRGAVSGLS
jgi:hypothetical protein